MLEYSGNSVAMMLCLRLESNNNASSMLFRCVPSFIFLLHNADLRVEGLFRVPGNSSRQQILKEALDSGTEIDLDSGEFHSNDVATLLKVFLGELPEPLLTHKHFHAHLKISGEKNGNPPMVHWDQSVLC